MPAGLRSARVCSDKKHTMDSPMKKSKTIQFGDADLRCVNTIRTLAADVVQKANSGHPGAPMGCAPMAHVLFTKSMKYAPATPNWMDRDRFVLSNGHACALLYIMLHLTGYDRPTMDDLKKFRQLDSVTPGHPERNHGLEGVEVTTGPLGQGISNAVGLAMAEKHLAGVFNEPDCEPIVDHFTFAICGDGCLQEGVSSEASSLAGHLKLSKLIVLYDDNSITIDGETSLSFTENVPMRYESYGWKVMSVGDGDHDLSSLYQAIEEAKAQGRLPDGKPTIINVKTTIGFGSTKQGTEAVHGSALGAKEVEIVKGKLGFDPQASFVVPEDVQKHYLNQKTKGEELLKVWETKFLAYQSKHPEKAAEFLRRQKGDLPEALSSLKGADVLPKYPPGAPAIASRNSSEKILNAIAEKLPELVGGSADLTGSNKTELKCTKDFQAENPSGRYFRYGVREHGMAAVCNGMAAHGMLIPFGATFLNFIGYALGAMRLSAISKLQVIYIMTHDSIGLGEDGPTHQPIESLISLRAIPNMYVFRPADGTEVSGTYLMALHLRHSPSVLCFSRQDLPCLNGTSVEGVSKGGYTIVHSGAAKDDVVLVSTGSEVYLCVNAAEMLKKDGVNVRVVSMPCLELFDQQDVEYKKQVFPQGVPVISVEASSVHGWARYSHYQIGMRTFGASAPYKQLYTRFGFDPDQISATAKKVIAFYQGKPVTWLVDTPALL